MLQILINLFWLIKIKTKSFCVSYHNHIFFHDYSMTLSNCCNFLLILLCWYKRYSICLISFFNFYELFLAFICANNIVSLVNSLFIVKIFNPFPFTLSSPSTDGMSDKSWLSAFYLLNFTLSVKVCYDCGLLFSSSFLYHLSYYQALINKLLRSYFLSITSFSSSSILLHSLQQMASSVFYRFVAFLYTFFIFYLLCLRNYTSKFN